MSIYPHAYHDPPFLDPVCTMFHVSSPTTHCITCSEITSFLTPAPSSDVVRGLASTATLIFATSALKSIRCHQISKPHAWQRYRRQNWPRSSNSSDAMSNLNESGGLRTSESKTSGRQHGLSGQSKCSEAKWQSISRWSRPRTRNERGLDSLCGHHRVICPTAFIHTVDRRKKSLIRRGQRRRMPTLAPDTCSTRATRSGLR